MGLFIVHDENFRPIGLRTQRRNGRRSKRSSCYMFTAMCAVGVVPTENVFDRIGNSQKVVPINTSVDRYSTSDAIPLGRHPAKS